MTLVYGVIVATVMTLNVLEGHSPIANLFKCDIFVFFRIFPSASAEPLVKFGAFNRNSGTIETIIVKFCPHVGRTGIKLVVLG